MRVAFLTLGTRGDVQPYVALARTLIKNGHEAFVCTGETFRSFVEENGVDFFPATADLMSHLKTPEGYAVFHGGGNPLKTMKFVKRVIMPEYKASMYDFLKATEGVDVIIYHPKALASPDIAQYRAIPCVCMPPVPIMVPIDEFPNLVVSSTGNFGAKINRLTYKINTLGLLSFMKMINEFRMQKLKLPKRSVSENVLDINGKPIPVVYPISKSLFEDVLSWDGRVELPGFFFLENNKEILDGDMIEFLQSGSKPYVISFSSMPLSRPGRFIKILEDALEDAGERAIIITGASGIEFSKDNGRILTIQQITHRLIFKEAKGVIHHGGVGTTAEALLSGKPQFIIPFNVDQPFWANRLYKLGLTIKPVREKDLSLSIMIKAFKDLANVNMYQKAQEMKKKLERENGTETMVRYLEKLV